MIVIRKKLLTFYVVVLGLLFVASGISQKIQEYRKSTLVAKAPEAQSEDSKTLVK